MEHESEHRDPTWQTGFDDGLAGRQSSGETELAYRSGYVAGSARRISRRTMMAVALATLAVPTTTALAGREPDPIFAAIDGHRRAWEALSGASDDQDHARLREAVLSAESEVVNTRPTTPAGVVALRTYHRELRERERAYPPPSHQYSNRGKG